MTGGIEAFFPLGELVDVESERKRLEKELENVTAEIERASRKLENPGFTDKAPPRIVAEERKKLEAYKETRDKVADNLMRLQKAE